MKRYKLIACQIAEHEIKHVLAKCENKVDVVLLEQKLHNTPNILRQELQAQVDATEANLEEEPYDAILFGYGLCSNSICGVSSKKIPVVIPRAHDCTTFFMGGKDRYADYFEKVKGTFFISEGWLENGFENGEALIERRRREYMDRYDGDEDTVDMLIEIEYELIKNYHALTCIYWPCMEHSNLMKEAKLLAEQSHWDYLEFEGGPDLMQAFVNGDWDEEQFLILDPGEEVGPTFDERVMDK